MCLEKTFTLLQIFQQFGKIKKDFFMMRIWEVTNRNLKKIDCQFIFQYIMDLNLLLKLLLLLKIKLNLL
jgi:hypothetical protein